MADALELHEGEVEVEKEFKSDYWRKHFVFIARNVVNTGLQIKESYSGRFCHHIGNPSMLILNRYSYVNVGGLVQIIPTGIKVTLKSGKSYKLSS